jgi:hypothetical protein
MQNSARKVNRTRSTASAAATAARGTSHRLVVAAAFYLFCFVGQSQCLVAGIIQKVAEEIYWRPKPTRTAREIC